MFIRFGCEITLSCPQDTPLIVLLSPRDERLDDLRRFEPLSAHPARPVSAYRDLFGNTCHRLVAPAGQTTLRCDGILEDAGQPEPAFPAARETPIDQLPDEALVYLLGSRYCETDRLSPIAWQLFGHLAPGWSRVQAIVDHVHAHIRFDYGQARPTRTAWEAWEEGTGVCRDFAHLAIAFCRAMNIPARYVNAWLGDIGVPAGGPMDFAASIEVFLDGRWHAFDPRNNARRIGRIVIARGRDAADVPLIHSFGPHHLTGFTVWTDEVSEAPNRIAAS